MKSKPEGIVRISNLLNLTRQEFTLLEKQIFILALLNLKNYQGFNLKLDNDETIKIEFSTHELKETNRERIKDALNKITSRKVYFDIFTKEKDHVGYLVPFSYASYTAVNGAYTKICIDINNRVKKPFFELANGFTSLDLKAVLSLKSVYSIRVYELMSQYINQGNWTVKLDDLRDLLGLQLLEYKNYGMFEKRILKYSQKELWEHCGIHFEWMIAQKERKKITALTFTIRTKEKQEKVQVNANIKETMDYIATLTPREIADKSHF